MQWQRVEQTQFGYAIQIPDGWTVREPDLRNSPWATAHFGDPATPLDHVAARAASSGVTLQADGVCDGSPRSIAFNVQGFRVAVHRRTGVVRILQSVHAADAGVVINPMQCRGQVEGGVAQALGAALYEDMQIGPDGQVSADSFRTYHIPSLADVPRTEVIFADTYDRLGPAGAKSMSESPYNPVAAALGNAIADATGARLLATPFAPDRIYRAVMAALSSRSRSAASALADPEPARTPQSSPVH